MCICKVTIYMRTIFHCCVKGGGGDCKLLTIYFSQAGMVVYPKLILSLPISQSTVIRHHLSRGYCLRLNYSGDVKTRNNPKPGNLGCKAKAQSLGGK